MKRIYTLFFLITVILGASLISCREGMSTYALEDLPDVVVDTTDMSELSVLQFEELSVTPNLKLNGISEADLDFEWRLYFVDDDTLSVIMSEKRNLEGYQIELLPSTEDDPYWVTYTVTDKVNDLEYILSWPLQVLNSLGEGLVVAETSNGTSTDLSLIMSPLVTTDYDDVSIKRNAYSTFSGQEISGLVKEMQFTTIYNETAILAITENSIVRVNRVDYTYGGKNDSLFFYVPNTYSPQELGKINQGTIFTNDGRFFGTYLGASRRFGAPFDTPFTVPGHVAMNAVAGVDVAFSFYDEVNGLFAYLATIQSFGDNQVRKAASVTGQAFNPADLPNMENLAAGTFENNNNFRHLLRDKTSGDIKLYILDGGASGGWGQPAISPAPVAVYNFSDAPEIENAEYFVLPENQRVMYYATKTKIYAAIYSASPLVFEERYTVPAGEEITTLQLYHEVDYPSSGTYIDTDGKQLVMSTYNGSEGKVYLLPIINLGVGNIDEANITVFEDFDRITAIEPQK